MFKLNSLVVLLVFCSVTSYGQLGTIPDEETKPKTGHINQNKFKQLYNQFSTPNMFRSASGVPGPAYYQQQADYKMDIELDDDKQKLYGEAVITYTNNSPDVLRYLWVQLDQNKRAKNSPSPLIEPSQIPEVSDPSEVVKNYLTEPFDGGFHIEYVKQTNGKALEYTINQTMMRVELPVPMQSGDKFSFKTKWWYNINEYTRVGGRSGFEHFPKDDNNLYVIAQFYPRMAVYSDVEGWQNSQFWGRDEFALPFGNFEVNITVPADHILDGTGKLTNRKEVFSKEMLKRYKKAQSSYKKPVLIVTQKEAEAAEKSKSKNKKTWKLYAENVRDFGFATSRKFIWDMMAVKIGDKNVMAVSLYPKEGNPLWEEWSTKTVASTLKSYSRMTFDYPYHKAISVHADDQGMEYPMICWNHGRPDENGVYDDRTKFGMISVIVHEIGHNFFPMIVNSDERQWTWMDEGLNTFLQYVAEQDLVENYPTILSPGMTAYPSRRGTPESVIPYMGGDQNYIAPIMSKGLNTYQFGSNAYGKPATALNILRETVMGRKLFDYAFKEYANRWKFKHPTPEDFFRTMEDASAFDLDWFWRGWFFTTNWVDMGVKDVKKYYITDKPNRLGRQIVLQYGIPEDKLVYIVEEGSEDYKNDSTLENKTAVEASERVKNFIKNSYSAGGNKLTFKMPKYFYNVTFEKPGGLVMPLIVEYTYADGSKEQVKYPAEIWRLNDNEVSKVVTSNKEIVSIKVDPKKETADIDTSNNTWPKEEQQSNFSRFKSQIQQ